MVKKRLIETSLDSRAAFDALKKLPKEVQDEIRDSNYREAQILTGALKRAAVASPTPQAKLLVSAIKPKRDRVVKVEIGGSKQVGEKYRSRKTGKRRGTSAGALVFGSEFGSTGKPVDEAGREMGLRFVANHNENGYWISPVFNKHAKEILERWTKLIQRVADRQGRGVS